MQSPVRIHAGIFVARFVLSGNNPGSPGFRLCGGTYTDLGVLLADDRTEFEVLDSASDASCVCVVSLSDVEMTSSGSLRTGNKWFR
ncbi:hypothetical protein DPMN_175309 [Dreissena polymorpha]|uniref:Uncharacterized protein n=1 Tax=Dreissena polymorpha TaxID=45954 RepID=A0A9D4E707_DREPO|nr:hypothetical protein DPMN_175309 [Dreissena polymorpha]